MFAKQGNKVENMVKKMSDNGDKIIQKVAAQIVCLEVEDLKLLVSQVLAVTEKLESSLLS